MIKVWDPLVRIGHWLLVAAFVVAYIAEGDWLPLHVWAGYLAGAIVAVRIVWGFVGTPRARFSDFIYAPGKVLADLRDLLSLSGKRYLGHGPLGGAMAVALLVLIAAVTLTGLTTLAEVKGEGPFSYFIAREDVVAPEAGGEERPLGPLDRIHELLANLTLLVIALHVALVALASFAHKENLIRAMFTGEKRE
jgi:cytochrome b